MFLTRPYKIIPFSSLNSKRRQKNSNSCMFDTKNMALLPAELLKLHQKHARTDNLTLCRHSLLCIHLTLY